MTTETIESLRAEVERLKEELAFEEGRIADLMADVGRLGNNNLKLREALSNLVKDAPADVDCDNMHHTKKDQHRWDETCPVVVRYGEAMDSAREALNATKEQP